MAPDFETHETGTRRALDEKDLEIARLRALVRQGVEVVDDFMPNIGNCAIQDHGRLNEFLIEGRKVADG